MIIEELVSRGNFVLCEMIDTPSLKKKFDLEGVDEMRDVLLFLRLLSDKPKFKRYMHMHCTPNQCPCLISGIQFLGRPLEKSKALLWSSIWYHIRVPRSRATNPLSLPGSPETCRQTIRFFFEMQPWIIEARGSFLPHSVRRSQQGFGSTSMMFL